MINRRQFLTTCASPLLAQRRQPNIVLLLADDLGYGELGFQGRSDFPTPHLDALASGGVRFRQGYVTAPFCCPSRAGLLTGRYQTRFGHELNVVGKRNLDPAIGLPTTEVTLADRLRQAGYRTGLVGKWHLGGAEAYHPQRRGFDEFYGFLHEGHFYVPPPYRGQVTRLRENEPPYDDDNPILRGRDPVEEKEYLTDALAREAEGFIARNAARPFFLYLAFNAVHSPMQAPVKRLAEFEGLKGEQRRLFASMTRAMDDAVGRVTAALRQQRLEEDTLILFLSDNGGPTAELTSSNAPLRGGKGQLYEGGIRVPFACSWKGRIRGGQTSDAVVSALDVAPTALAAAGVDAPAGLDGFNLLPHLREGAAFPRQTHYWRYGPNLAWRRGNWKIVKQRTDSFALFDLHADPGEQQDLAAARPALRRELEAELMAMNQQMRSPLWS